MPHWSRWCTCCSSHLQCEAVHVSRIKTTIALPNSRGAVVKILLNIFRGLFSGPRTRTHTRRKSVRLGVEAFEDRMVPSASSFNLHAVMDTSGVSSAFYTDRS